MKLETEEIINSIRSGKTGREKAISYLYQNEALKNGIKKVLSESSETTHFYDIFNLTLVKFMKIVLKKEDFTISTNLHSYLFVIAKNLHLQKVKKNKFPLTDLPEKYDTKSPEPDIEMILMDDERNSALKEIIEKMGRNCYEILYNWAAGFSMLEMATMFSYNSAEVVRRKKFLCLKRLSEFLDENPWKRKSLMK